MFDKQNKVQQTSRILRQKQLARQNQQIQPSSNVVSSASAIAASCYNLLTSASIHADACDSRGIAARMKTCLQVIHKDV